MADIAHVLDDLEPTDEAAQFDDMVEACIDANVLVSRVGSEKLQEAMRATLVILGCDVSRRLQADVSGAPSLN